MEKKMESLHNLERIRKEKHLTRKDLEKLSGVKEITIHHIERGITDVDNIKLSTLIKLSKALKCKVKDLVSNDLRKYIG